MQGTRFAPSDFPLVWARVLRPREGAGAAAGPRTIQRVAPTPLAGAAAGRVGWQRPAASQAVRDRRAPGATAGRGSRRTALQVAGKQLRVAGQECALPPPPPLRLRPTFCRRNGSRNWRSTRPPGRPGAAEHPCQPRRYPRADLPLLPRERVGAALARVGHGSPRVAELPGKNVTALPPRPAAGCASSAESAAPLLLLGRGPSTSPGAPGTGLGRGRAGRGLGGIAGPQRGSPGSRSSTCLKWPWLRVVIRRDRRMPSERHAFPQRKGKKMISNI